MAVTNEQFKAAFRDVMAAEFADIPREHEIVYTFSDAFTRRMDKLIRSQRNPFWGLVNTAMKRAVVCCTMVLVLFVSAFSVRAIREPVIRFFVEIYETFVEYVFECDKADAIDREYTLGNLPDGFVQTDYERDAFSILTVYQNDAGDTIEFCQYIPNVQHTVDSEDGYITTLSINDVEVQIASRDTTTYAIWNTEDCSFSISYFGNTDIDTLQKMVTSVC